MAGAAPVAVRIPNGEIPVPNGKIPVPNGKILLADRPLLASVPCLAVSWQCRHSG